MNMTGEDFDTTERDPIRIAHATVTDISRNGSVFSLVSVGGRLEACYIPPRISAKSGLREIGDTATVQIVPNFPDKSEAVPWRALSVSKEPVSVSEADKKLFDGIVGLDELVWKQIVEIFPETPFTLKVLMEELEDVDLLAEANPELLQQSIARMLSEWQKSGRLAMARLYRPGGNTSFCIFYALHTNHLLDTLQREMDSTFED